MSAPKHRVAHTPNHNINLNSALERTKVEFQITKPSMKEVAIKNIRQEQKRLHEMDRNKKKNHTLNHRKTTHNLNNKRNRNSETIHPEITADLTPPETTYYDNRPFESRLHTQREQTAIIEGLGQIINYKRKKH